MIVFASLGQSSPLFGLLGTDGHPPNVTSVSKSELSCKTAVVW